MFEVDKIYMVIFDFNKSDKWILGIYEDKPDGCPTHNLECLASDWDIGARGISFKRYSSAEEIPISKLPLYLGSKIIYPAMERVMKGDIKNNDPWRKVLGDPWRKDLK